MAVTDFVRRSMQIVAGGIAQSTKDYFDNAFVNGFETNEYVLRQNPGATTNYSFMLKDNLVTGTYKIEFILYGDSSVVGTLEKYIIIK